MLLLLLEKEWREKVGNLSTVFVWGQQEWRPRKRAFNAGLIRHPAVPEMDREIWAESAIAYFTGRRKARLNLLVNELPSRFISLLYV